VSIDSSSTPPPDCIWREGRRVGPASLPTRFSIVEEEIRPPAILPHQCHSSTNR
jgi:hypothetical protein